MRSKKAEKRIYHIEGDRNWKIAKEAIELAEEEMTEKVVEAFKMACDKYDDGRELCWSGYSCKDTCCSKKDLFTQKLKEL